MKNKNRLFLPFLLLTLLFLFSFTCARAQKSDSTQNPLRAGRHALEFQISDKFNLKSFTGSAISYKWQVTQKRAHRIGVSLNQAFDDENHSVKNAPDSNSFRINSSVAIYYSWMNYVNPKSEIKFYYGYGPGINFGYSQNRVKNKAIPRASVMPTKGINKSFQIGISGQVYAGVEWFFQHSMSLHAEYTGSLVFNFNQQKRIIKNHQMGSVTIQKTTAKDIRFGGNGVRFGLSVYF